MRHERAQEMRGERAKSMRMRSHRKTWSYTPAHHMFR